MPEARDWVLDRKITDDLVGPGLTHELRAWLTSCRRIGWPSSSSAASPTRTCPTTSAAVSCSAFRELDPAGFVLPPLPNTLFMRDNTAWIFGGVTLNPMYWPARRQETLLTTAIYKFHPAFADEKFDVWLGDLDGRPTRPRRGDPRGRRRDADRQGRRA